MRDLAGCAKEFGLFLFWRKWGDPEGLYTEKRHIRIVLPGHGYDELVDMGQR